MAVNYAFAPNAFRFVTFAYRKIGIVVKSRYSNQTMKTYLKMICATASFGLGCISPALIAQELPPSPPPGEGPGMHGQGPGDGILVRLAEELSLTQEQTAQVKAILDADKKALDAIRDSNTDRETAHAQFEAVIKASRAKIRELLTADQQKIFDAMKPAGHRGPPPPPPGTSCPAQE